MSLYQSGQTPDDGEYRWMGSVAMDQTGDIAIGYSRSSATSGDYPSIYYAGQTAGDPLGTTETEALIKQGSGSQPDTDDRWGDYSSMALDGNDSCTFWYTTEYYPATGSVRLGHVARFAQVPELPLGVGERQRVSGGFEKGRSLISGPPQPLSGFRQTFV